jgi:phosphate starvation-inducible PhoH-like protein
MVVGARFGNTELHYKFTLVITPHLCIMVHTVEVCGDSLTKVIMANKKGKKYTNNKECVNIWDRATITAKNDKQKTYLNAIDNANIILGTGVSGSGKSTLAAWKAIDMLDDNSSPIERIIIARPNQIEGTRSLGSLPGTKNEKMMPWVAPVANAIKKRIGKYRYEKLVEREIIELLPLEHIKGLTFDNTFVIIDEAEDIEWSVLKTLLLRKGMDSKLAINGDIRQQSLRGTSGLSVILGVLEKHHYVPIRHIDFDDWKYCVRDKDTAGLGQLFEDLGI